MILSEFTRVLDISWIDFLWSSLWAVLIIIIFNFMIMVILIPVIYEWMVKNIMPKIYNGKLGKLQEENKRLKEELGTTISEKEEYRAKLVTIKLSAEVRSI